MTLITLPLTSCLHQAEPQKQAPKVIIIMTDDQGYGDLACHGNPYLKTPNLDALYDIINRHGGKLHITSGRDVGTTVDVVLPCRAPREECRA